jgi:hypothetical protein
MKKIIFLFLFFALAGSLFGRPKYTWKTVAVDGCYAMYSCVVISKNAICTYGSNTGWVFICPPWYNI